MYKWIIIFLTVCFCSVNSQTVINYDIIDSKFKKRIVFNVVHDSDIDLAMKIIQNQIFLNPLILISHYADASAIPVEVTGFTDKFVTLRAFVWTKDVDDAAKLNNEINKVVFDEFKKHGIRFSDPVTPYLK